MSTALLPTQVRAAGKAVSVFLRKQTNHTAQMETLLIPAQCPISVLEQAPVMHQMAVLISRYLHLPQLSHRIVAYVHHGIQKGAPVAIAAAHLPKNFTLDHVPSPDAVPANVLLLPNAVAVGVGVEQEYVTMGALPELETVPPAIHVKKDAWSQIVVTGFAGDLDAIPLPFPPNPIRLAGKTLQLAAPESVSLTAGHVTKVATPPR